MKIVALDLATNTGWACGEHDGTPRFGTLRLPSTGDDLGRFFCAFDDWFSSILVIEKPELVAFEAPLLLAGGATSIVTVRKLMGLAAIVEFMTVRRRLISREGNLATIKKFWTGQGNAKKPQMIATARAYGFDVRNDNEADALALWCYSVHSRFADQRHRWGLGALGRAASKAARPSALFKQSSGELAAGSGEEHL